MSDNDINILASNDLNKDYNLFITAVCDKFKIKNKDKFEKEFYEFVQQNMKNDFFERKPTEDEVEEITDKFFSIIENHGETSNFLQDAIQEAEKLKKIR